MFRSVQVSLKFSLHFCVEFEAHKEYIFGFSLRVNVLRVDCTELLKVSIRLHNKSSRFTENRKFVFVENSIMGMTIDTLILHLHREWLQQSNTKKIKINREQVRYDMFSVLIWWKMEKWCPFLRNWGRCTNINWIDWIDWICNLKMCQYCLKRHE